MLSTPPPAKYATRRNPANPSFGARAAAVAAMLGTPFMPWQRQVSDVILEINPDKPGTWRYPLVVVTVPRQAGKTAWGRSILVDRMMNYNRCDIRMTAQTGKDAREQWDKIIEALAAEKKRGSFEVRKSAGRERLTYLKRLSRISPFAPTPSSLHGTTLNLVFIDEAWSFDSSKGAALEAAITPTMATVKDSQLIVVSTRGTATSSPYLDALIEKGRASIHDPNSTMAYFEWSADETAADADPFSDETLSFHPAIGYTQSAEKIRSSADTDLSNFRRSYLNLPTVAETTLVDIGKWDNMAAKITPPEDLSKIHIAFDVSELEQAATIFAAWKKDGTNHLQVVKSSSGLSWLIPTITELSTQGFASISYDDSGRTRTIVNDLPEDVKLRIGPLTPREYGTACQMMLDRIRAEALIHDGHAGLRDGLLSAAVKQIGGAIGFDARKSAGSIDALRAATVALYKSATDNEENVQIFI